MQIQKHRLQQLFNVTWAATSQDKRSLEAAAVHRQFPMEKGKPRGPAPSTGQHQLKPEANALVGFF